MSIQAIARIRCLRVEGRRARGLIRRIIQRQYLPDWMQPDRIYRDRSIRYLTALQLKAVLN